VDAAQLAGFLGQRASLEEAGGPEPLVDAHGVHGFIFTQGDGGSGRLRKRGAKQ